MSSLTIEKGNKIGSGFQHFANFIQTSLPVIKCLVNVANSFRWENIIKEHLFVDFWLELYKRDIAKEIDLVAHWEF